MKYFPSNDSAKIIVIIDLKSILIWLAKMGIIMSSSAKFSNLDPNNRLIFKYHFI